MFGFLSPKRAMLRLTSESIGADHDRLMAYLRTLPTDQQDKALDFAADYFRRCEAAAPLVFQGRDELMALILDLKRDIGAAVDVGSRIALLAYSLIVRATFIQREFGAEGWAGEQVSAAGYYLATFKRLLLDGRQG